MTNDNTIAQNGSSLRYCLVGPLALMIASLISCCVSYSNAKQSITKDLNDAVLAIANENSVHWTRPDTIAALRQMYETTHKPLIYPASDVNFKNSALKDEVYFTIALVDKNNVAPKIGGNKIVSDSIMLMPERAADGLGIHIQCFADCSMASILSISDKTFPGILISLSILSMAGMILWQRKETELPEMAVGSVLSARDPLEGIKLTPMQRRFVQMLLDAPDRRVDKKTLCETLWGNKSNAEESLYTLVRRAKAALAMTNMEIICNRGDSYEIHINN